MASIAVDVVDVNVGARGVGFTFVRFVVIGLDYFDGFLPRSFLFLLLDGVFVFFTTIKKKFSVKFYLYCIFVLFIFGNFSMFNTIRDSFNAFVSFFVCLSDFIFQVRIALFINQYNTSGISSEPPKSGLKSSLLISP